MTEKRYPEKTAPVAGWLSRRWKLAGPVTRHRWFRGLLDEHHTLSLVERIGL